MNRLNLEGTTPESTDPIGTGTCYPFRPQTSAWLAFTPAATDTYQFSLCGSRTSAALEGYTGNSWGPYTFVAGLCVTQTTIANNCATAPNAATTLTADTTYRLMLTNYFSRDLGPMTISISRGAFSPVATTISPVAGPTAGNTVVTITGSGFGNGTTVKIGGANASSVQVLSPFVLAATTGAHPNGIVDVAVTTGAGTSTLGNAFTHVAGSRRRPTGHSH